MTTKLRNALGAAIALVAALLIALFTGALDGVLRRVGVEIAGRPASIEPAGSDVVATTPAAPSAAPAPAGGDAVIAERVVPVFDLVRVEPSGDAVIAGQGTPDGTVEIFSGAGVVAEGKVNASGEWAIVLKDPLPAGPHDLKVRVRTADGQVIGSEQSVAVSVPEGGKGEVLVVLNTPGAPATVLQIPGLEEPQRRVGETGGDAAAPTGTEVAGATAPAVTVPATPSPDTATRSADAGAAPPAASNTPKASAGAPAAQDSAAAPGAAPSQSAAAPAPEPAPASQASTASSEAPQAPTPSASGSSTAGAEAAASTEQSVTATAPVAPATPAPAAGLQPVEGGASANAPSGPEPSAAPASGGETVVVAGASPEQPATTVTPSTAEPPATAADATAPASGSSAAGGSPAVAVAGDQLAAAPSDAAGEAPQGGATIAGTTTSGQAAPPRPAPVTVDAVELEDGKKFYAAGSAAPGATVRVYVDDKPVADTKAMEKGRWLLETKLPLGPGKHAVRVDQIGPTGTVLARSEVPYELAEELPSAPTGASGSGVAAAGSGTFGEARGQPETLIIRRGDNLWRIARRLYGHGMRYSTIYQANAEQIRNPDLIYPGQIFVLPQGDTAWRAVEPTTQPQ